MIIKIMCFKCFLKRFESVIQWSDGGRSFQARGPEYENARLPISARQPGLMYWTVSADHRQICSHTMSQIKNKDTRHMFTHRVTNEDTKQRTSAQTSSYAASQMKIETIDLKINMCTHHVINKIEDNGLEDKHGHRPCHKPTFTRHTIIRKRSTLYDNFTLHGNKSVKYLVKWLIILNINKTWCRATSVTQKLLSWSIVSPWPM